MHGFERVQGLDVLALMSNGAITGGNALRNALWELDGKTLAFTAPSSATVTFAAKSPAEPMTAADVIAQLNDQAPNIKAYLRDGRLSLSAASAVAISGTGTANVVLGFPKDGVIGVAYNSPGGPIPRIVTFVESTAVAGEFYVWTER